MTDEEKDTEERGIEINMDRVAELVGLVTADIDVRHEFQPRDANHYHGAVGYLTAMLAMMLAREVDSELEAELDSIKERLLDLVRMIVASTPKQQETLTQRLTDTYVMAREANAVMGAMCTLLEPPSPPKEELN